MFNLIKKYYKANILMHFGSFLFIGLCYHSVSVITFGLAQSDHNKRLLLYMLLFSYMLHKLKINSEKSGNKYESKKTSSLLPKLMVRFHIIFLLLFQLVKSDSKIIIFLRFVHSLRVRMSMIL